MKGSGLFFPVVPEFTVHDMNQRYETVKGELNRINGSYSVMDIPSEAEVSRFVDHYLEAARAKYGHCRLIFGDKEFNLLEPPVSEEPILGDLYRE